MKKFKYIVCQTGREIIDTINSKGIEKKDIAGILNVDGEFYCFYFE